MAKRFVRLQNGGGIEDKEPDDTDRTIDCSVGGSPIPDAKQNRSLDAQLDTKHGLASSFLFRGEGQRSDAPSVPGVHKGRFPASKVSGADQDPYLRDELKLGET